MGTPGPPLLCVGDNAKAAAGTGGAARPIPPRLLRLVRGAPTCSGGSGRVRAPTVLAVVDSLRHASKAGVSEAGADEHVRNQRDGWAGRAAPAGRSDEAPAGSCVDVVEEGLAKDEDDEAIALEIATVGLRVWRGLAVPWHQSSVCVEPPGVSNVTLPPWSG